MAVNVLSFEVYGPFEIPMEKGKVGNFIPINCPKFWINHADLMDRIGCYVFAIRAAKGYRPIYVGMTKNNFGKECFTGHKIAQHYTPTLMNLGKGTPIMFFVVPEKKRGNPNKKIIKDLESFLIQVGVAKNPDLSNIQEKQEAKWSIPGVLRGRGKPSKEASAFKKVMGL